MKVKSELNRPKFFVCKPTVCENFGLQLETPTSTVVPGRVK